MIIDSYCMLIEINSHLSICCVSVAAQYTTVIASFNELVDKSCWFCYQCRIRQSERLLLSWWIILEPWKLMFTCATAWLVVVLMLPIIVLLWITESKQQTAKRLRKRGNTYKVIASHLKVSVSTARRYCIS